MKKKKKYNTYLQIYKMQIIKSLTYKFDVYGNIIMQSIIMVASAFFWRALFANSDTVKGVDVETMLTYTVVSSMISVLLTTNVERRIMMSVEKGTIAIDMMRPVNIFKMYFAENLASITALVFQNLIPIFVIGSLFIKIPAPASLTSFGLFAVSMLLAFFINWLIAVCFGIWSFWVIEMDALIQVKKHLIRLLSGSIIPVWFFPETVKNVLECLPFVYLYQMPLDLYIGKYDNSTLIKGFVVQSVWLIALFVFYSWLKKKVAGKVMVQGG